MNDRSPAMGGVIVRYEVGIQLSIPAIFFERVDGKLERVTLYNTPVITGLVPVIQSRKLLKLLLWITGTSPVMTKTSDCAV